MKYLFTKYTSVKDNEFKQFSQTICNSMEDTETAIKQSMMAHNASHTEYDIDFLDALITKGVYNYHAYMNGVGYLCRVKLTIQAITCIQSH